MTTETIIVQGIGIAGVVCFVISYQIKSNKGLYIIQMAGTALFCIQFLLLGAITGCLNLVVIIIRNIMLTGFDKWAWVRWKGWVWITTGVCVVILISTWQGPLGLLPFIALVGSTIGYWTNNAQKIRLSNMVCASPAWLIYDACICSVGGVLNESITLISVLISIYRYGWKNMGENKF